MLAYEGPGFGVRTRNMEQADTRSQIAGEPAAVSDVALARLPRARANEDTLKTWVNADCDNDGDIRTFEKGHYCLVQVRLRGLQRPG
jgi:hypothetical protein